MSCKPETEKQRLERIAVQILGGFAANVHLATNFEERVEIVGGAILSAQELIKQLDALVLDE